MKLSLFLFVLLAALPVWGQTLPDKPQAQVRVEFAPKHYYRDWKWWAGTAVIAGATALDVQSSCRAFHEGYVESNFVIRGSQSCGQVAGFGFSFAALEVGLHAFVWHCQQDDFFENRTSESDGVEGTVKTKGRCYGMNQYSGKHKTLNEILVYGTIPAIQAGVHIPATIHNYAQPRLP